MNQKNKIKQKKTKKNVSKPTIKTVPVIVYQIVLGVLFFFAYTYIFDTKLDGNGDNYNYLNYAFSILEGHGYSSPYSPQYSPTNWFPPAYSALLATMMFFIGKSTFLLKALNGLFFLGGILMLNKIMGKEMKNILISSLIALLLILNSELLRLSTVIMSEMLYLFLSILVLYCLSKMEDKPPFWKSKYFYGIVIGSVLCFYTRSVGIVVIVSVLINWLIQKKWKLAGIYACAVSLLYLPWVIRNAIHGLEGRYLGTVMTINPWQPEKGQISSVSEFIDKMQVNLYDTVIKGFPEAIFPFFDYNSISSTTIVIFGIILLAFVSWGVFNLKELRYYILFFILGNIGIFLLWHGGNGIRYVRPIIPIVVYCFFYGIYSLKIKSIKPQIFQKLVYAIPIILLFFYVPKLKDLQTIAKQELHPAYKNYFELAKSVKAINSDSPPLVVCRKPSLFHWHSDSYASNYPYSLDDKVILKNFIDKKVDYVVIEQLGYGSTGRYLVPAITKNQELFKVVKQLKNPDTYLLKFDIENARKKL